MLAAPVCGVGAPVLAAGRVVVVIAVVVVVCVNRWMYVCDAPYPSPGHAMCDGYTVKPVVKRFPP